MRTTLQVPQAVLLLLLLAAMVKADLRGASSSTSSRAIGYRSVDELLQVPSAVSEDAPPQERWLAAKPGLSTNDVLEGPGGKKPSKKGQKSKTSSEVTPPDAEDSEMDDESDGEITTRQSSSSGGLSGNVGRAPVATEKFEFVLVCICTWQGGEDPPARLERVLGVSVSL
jgi:hypothetical protein